MKIYTGGGDKGKTGLFSGERVSKADARIDAYGDVDELNSMIGVIIAHVDDGRIKMELTAIQNELISLSAWLATTPGAPSVKHLVIPDGNASRDLEAAIDRMEKELPKLKVFILPGGSKKAAFTHLGRTVCRRAERKVIAFIHTQNDVDDTFGKAFTEIAVFMNRLSDYLFVLARYLDKDGRENKSDGR